MTKKLLILLAMATLLAGCEHNRHRRDYYDDDRRGRWGYDHRRHWDDDADSPRLSDMQRRALENCAMLAPRDQPRCRATVWSTVRP